MKYLLYHNRKKNPYMNTISKPPTTAEYITKAILKHGNKYTYDRTMYVRSKNKLIITCPIHGDFEQQAGSHLRGIGCTECGYLSMRSSGDIFIEKSKSVHGDKYVYDKVIYINSKKKVTITCPIHGDFEQYPCKHSSNYYKRGCEKCGGSKKSNILEFIEKSKQIHGDKYLYNKSIYLSAIKKLIITCPIHGDFEQEPRGHLVGYGCESCSRENSGWSRKSYVDRAGDREVMFYVVLCKSSDTNEEFFKIGITYFRDTEKPIFDRYRSNKSKRMPYDYELISSVIGSASDMWDLESSEKERLSQFKYRPKLMFAGHTECFSSID